MNPKNYIKRRAFFQQKMLILYMILRDITEQGKDIKYFDYLQAQFANYILMDLLYRWACIHFYKNSS